MKKKIIAILLAAVVAIGLTACGGAKESADGSAAAADETKIETIGDAMAIESDSTSSSYDEENFVYVFDNNGVPTRVIAPMTKELYEQTQNLDFSAEDYQEQYEKLVAPLKVTSIEDLSVGIPSQEELDKLIGKTGQELLDDGYTAWGHMITAKSTEFSMSKGLYLYTVAFEENIDGKYDEDTPDEEMLKDLTVKSVKYETLSDQATDPSVKP